MPPRPADPTLRPAPRILGVVLTVGALGAITVDGIGCIRDSDVEGEGDRDGGGNSASEVSSTSDKGVTGFDFRGFVFFMLARVCS